MRVKKAIIPAAGLGTRFLPITKAVPKPMLSVLDKPTIQYIAEELISVGIEDIIIVVSPDSQVIEKHFGPAPELEERLIKDGKFGLYEIERETQRFNVTFAVQKEANGLAGAVLCAEPYLDKDEPFALLLGDELMYAAENETPCIKTLVDIFERTGKNVIATMEVFGDDVSKYGNFGIKSEEEGAFLVDRIIEKPALTEALSNYALIGRYVLSGKVMGMLKNLEMKGSELCFTDALDVLAENGELLAAPFEGKRYDVGDKLGYVKANVEFAARNAELGEEIREYLREFVKTL